MPRFLGATLGALIIVLFMNQLADPIPSVTVSWSISAIVVPAR